MKRSFCLLLSSSIALLAVACGGTVPLGNAADGSAGGTGTAGGVTTIANGGSALGGAATTGGAAAAGGTVTVGGTATLGGAVAVGGTPASGGTIAVGGTLATGGAIAAGGSAGGVNCALVGCAAPPLCTTGCTASCGCCPCSEGTVQNGLVCTSGCWAATGGSTGTGGTAPTTGGSTAGVGGTTGGAANTGGTRATGGTTNTLATGGTKATGGVTATGGSTSTSIIDDRPGAPCNTTDDCKLVSDCCTCDVYSANASTPSCNIPECKASACELKGIDTTEYACIAGRCVFQRSCDTSTVQCTTAMPSCPAGEVPSVLANCYGPCLPIGRCRDVTSCDGCTAAGLSCVTLVEMPRLTVHCVNTPQNCQGEPTCECMGVCKSVFLCNDPSSQTLTCSCPDC